jgi:hypothetical protein
VFTMDSDDVGGGWILVETAVDACSVTPTPTPNPLDLTNPTVVVGFGLGALLIGLLVGRMTKRSNR